MRATTILVLCWYWFAPAVIVEPPIQANFVVATTGSDENPGTAAKPFVTLGRARDAVRKLNAGGPPQATVTVLVRGGTYVLKDTPVFGPADSGTPERRIVYAAYPGEKPVLSGGREITGWKRGEGKRWVAEVPTARGGAWRFTAVRQRQAPDQGPVCRTPMTGRPPRRGKEEERADQESRPRPVHFAERRDLCPPALQPVGDRARQAQWTELEYRHFALGFQGGSQGQDRAWRGLVGVSYLEPQPECDH